MGTEYFVCCKDCKVKRDLDKFYPIGWPVNNRKEALEFSDTVKEYSFRAGLLVSFMGKHWGLSCFVCHEHDLEAIEIKHAEENGRDPWDIKWADDKYMLYQDEEVDFWKDEKEEGDPS